MNFSRLLNRNQVFYQYKSKLGGVEIVMNLLAVYGEQLRVGKELKRYLEVLL